MKYQKGFTLIETLMAILILTMTVGALLSLAAGGFFSVRYGRNQIIANNLLQESLEYVRNSRDTAFLQGQTWNDWKQKLSVDESGDLMGSPDDLVGCFGESGCYVDPYTQTNQIRSCGTGSSAICPNVKFYQEQSLYAYEGTYPFGAGEYLNTSYRRSITLVSPASDPDQVIVTGTITWLDGSLTKKLVQSIVIANWRP